jgi:hypothetical protein
MSDILAVFGILILLGIAYPGLLLFCWLLFPSLTERAREQIATRPQRSFWSGLGLAILLLLPTMLLLSLPSGVMKGLGWILILVELACSGLGAVGLAREIGNRLAKNSAGSMSLVNSFVRGAAALELAVIFPLIGWVFIFPITTLTSLGAAFYAFTTRKRSAPVPAPAASNPVDAMVSAHDALNS